MDKNSFLNSDDTRSLSTWLAEIVTGVRPLDFRHTRGVYATFGDALDTYAWPPKRVDVTTPNGQETITKEQSLVENERLLGKLSNGLRSSLALKAEDDLALWVEAILKWGGVYTRLNNGGGNAGWLARYREDGGLCTYLSDAVEKLDSASEDTVGLQIKHLRSNAGLTKIYSLACQDFVIYDSRVAAALSWLISKWAKNPSLVPCHLRFATMRAKTSKKEGKQRSADTHVFPYFSPTGNVRNHVKHLQWNLRANWLLQQTMQCITDCGYENKLKSLRDFEAALFVLGDDLSKAR